MNLYTKIVQNRCGMVYVVVYLKKKLYLCTIFVRNTKKNTYDPY